MKRTCKLVLPATLVVVVLAGCGDSSPPPADASVDARGQPADGPTADACGPGTFDPDSGGCLPPLG